jgi:hypothetical protein
MCLLGEWARAEGETGREETFIGGGQYAKAVGQCVVGMTGTTSEGTRAGTSMVIAIGTIIGIGMGTMIGFVRGAIIPTAVMLTWGVLSFPCRSITGRDARCSTTGQLGLSHPMTLIVAGIGNGTGILYSCMTMTSTRDGICSLILGSGDMFTSNSQASGRRNSYFDDSQPNDMLAAHQQGPMRLKGSFRRHTAERWLGR